MLRNSTDTIRIESKEDKDGIDIYVKAGSKNGSVHIPVVLTETGFKDKVYNDFFIGEGPRWRSWLAAVSTTAAVMTASTTASTPST